MRNEIDINAVVGTLPLDPGAHTIVGDGVVAAYFCIVALLPELRDPLAGRGGRGEADASDQHPGPLAGGGLLEAVPTVRGPPITITDESCSQSISAVVVNGVAHMAPGYAGVCGVVADLAGFAVGVLGTFDADAGVADSETFDAGFAVGVFGAGNAGVVAALGRAGIGAVTMTEALHALVGRRVAQGGLSGAGRGVVFGALAAGAIGAGPQAGDVGALVVS
jgi:hypothetical protein